MGYYFMIGITLLVGFSIGVSLIIYSIKKLNKLKKLEKIPAIVMGYHSHMGRDSYITRVEIERNGKKVERDLDYYSVFVSKRKGKKINVYYDEKTNNVDCVYGYIFTIILGLLFIVGTFYIISTL